MKIEQLRKSIEQLRTYPQKIVGGNVFFIKNKYCFLVIGRNHLGIATIINSYGDWSDEEKESACIIYYETDASKF